MSQKERLVFNPSSIRCKLLVSGREYIFFLTWIGMNPGVQDPFNFKPAWGLFVGGSEVQDQKQSRKAGVVEAFSPRIMGNNGKLLYKMDCKAIHPGKLIWNLKIIQLKRKIIFQTSIFGFHANSPGSRRTFGSLSPAPWSSEEGWLFFADNDATWRRSKRASTKACNMSKPFEMHAAHDIRPGIHIDRLRWISLNQDVVSVLCRALCVFNWMRGSIIVLLFGITWDSTLSFSHWWGQKWVSVIVMHPEKGRWEPENDDFS